MKLTKIIAFLIALCIYWFFALISTANEKPIDKFDFDYIEKWEYSVDISWDWHKISDLNNDSSYKYSKISFFDEVYHTKNSTVNVNWDELLLNEWIFYISINDIWRKYKINWLSFVLENKSPWNILVDTRNDKKVKIYSFDMLARLSLIDTISWDEATSFYLYPHTFFWYKWISNSVAKWADLYRILQLYRLKYVQAPFSLWWSFNGDFSNSINYTIKNRPVDAEWLSFLKFIFNVRDNYSELKNDFQELKNIKVWSSLAVKFIQENIDFFRNNDKKVIYLKNRALAQIDWILKVYSWESIQQDFKENNSISWEIWEINNDLALELIKTLKDLQKESEEWFNEMLKILSYYNYVIVNYNDHSLTNLKQTYNIVLSEFYWTQKDIEQGYLKINTIYSSFDNWEVSVSELYSMLDDYITTRFPRVNGIIAFKPNDIPEVLSLSFSMYNIIDSAVSGNESSDLHILEDDNFIEFISLYYELNWVVVDKSAKDSKDKLKETYLTNYKNLLEKFDKVIRYYYFEEDLSDNNLLVTKEWINKVLYSKFKDFFSDNLLSTVVDNKWLLKSNSVWVNELSDKFEEYFLALDDYPTYKNSFISNLPDPIWVSSESRFEMSYQKLLSYMSQFENFSLAEKNVEINHNRKVYIVSWARTFWSDISFHLEPFIDHRISKIVIDWQPRPWFYELDIIRQDMLDRTTNGKEVSDEDKFSKFFYNKFFADREIKDDAEIFEVEENDIKLSASEFQFVSEKLLSKSRWEFRNINNWNHMTIWIPNISLESNSSWYDIFIKWADIKIRSEDLLSFWEFDSKYKFTSEDHYFYDISMKLKNRSKAWVSDKYMWVPLSVDWKIEISEFNDKIKEIWRLFTVIDYVYFKKESEILDDLEVIYYPEWSEMALKYTSKSNKSVIFKAKTPFDIILYREGSNTIISTPTDFNNLRF